MIEVKEDWSEEKYWKRVVHFRIDQSFKGITGKEVEVVTGFDGASCGYRFQTGEGYLVYADLITGIKNYWHTGLCHRNLPIAEAEDDLAYFRALPKAGSGGSVLGRVTQLSRQFNKPDEYITSFPENILITVDGPSGHFVALTNKDGRYQVTGLSPGSYLIHAELPERQDTPTTYKVDVVDRGCAAADFETHLRGQISGLVADEDGSPIPNIRVDIITVKDAQQSPPQGKKTYTDEQGNFILDWLPPGKYYLGIGLLNAQSNRCSYPRTYLPGVSNISSAEITDMLAIQKLENQIIIAPSFTPDLEIEVEVVWPDGRPLETGTVILHSSGHSFPITPEGATNAGPGVFRIRGFKGCGYWLKAFTYGHPGEPGGGDPWHNEVEIDPSKELTKPLRLELSKPGADCRHEHSK